MSLSHCKALALEDFSDPRLRELIRAVFSPELERCGPQFPSGFEHRKHWEVAQAITTFEDAGLLDGRAEILGVAAGSEPTIFWLTERAARVVATDLYREPGVWDEFASDSMLTDPGSHWWGSWDPERLEVEHMDALDLRFGDASFDGIFSSSSIEHFGSPADARRAVEEMHRVLRPGGVLTLSTELRIDGPSPGAPGCLMFDPAELEELLLDGLDWRPLDPFDFALSGATLAAATTPAQVERQASAPGDWLRVPHLVLRHEQWLWTSCHVALRKPA